MLHTWPWDPNLPVGDQLAHVRQWGGPPRWLASLDHAEQLLEPIFAGRRSDWPLSAAAPGVAVMLYLLSREHNSPVTELTTNDVAAAYPELVPRARLHQQLHAAGHDVDDLDSTEALVLVWHHTLLAAVLDTPSDVHSSESAQGPMVATVLPALLGELRHPGAWLWPPPPRSDRA